MFNSAIDYQAIETIKKHKPPLLLPTFRCSQVKKSSSIYTVFTAIVVTVQKLLLQLWHQQDLILFITVLPTKQIYYTTWNFQIYTDNIELRLRDRW